MQAIARRRRRSQVATKQIINADIGTGWKYFEGSGVDELIHSGAVVIETRELRFVYCSGRTATRGDTDEVVAPGDIEEQTRQVLRNLKSALDEAGATFDDVVRMRVFITPPFSKENFGKIHKARAEVFRKEHYPASTLVIVHELARPEAMIEIDCDAVVIKGAG
jgi:2-iminobutanoate/2-iminopropanoate deaminase